MSSSSDSRGPGAPDHKPGGDPARSSAYSRFIPREELTAFSAWQLGAFGDGQQGGASKPGAPAAAPKEPPPPPPPTPQVVAQIKAARDGGYHDGYRDGMAALESFKQNYAAQVSAQVGAVVQAAQSQLDALERDLAQRVAGIALEIARQVVRAELHARPQHVVAVAQEALSALLVTARHVTLRLHPDDHGLVAAGAAETLAARGARLVADARIARGGCLVESDIGSVDAQVASRWQRAAATLGHESGWVDDGAAPAAGDAA
jgi:flagellar assembly protein FliH